MTATKDEFESRALGFVAPQALVISTNEEYLAGGDRLKAAKAFLEEAEKHHRGDIDKAFSLHKSLLGKLKAIKEPVQAYVDAYDKALLDFDRRARAEAEAERQRLEDEERARLERERQARADELAAAGNAKAAKAALKVEIVVPIVKVAGPPKIEGRSVADVWGDFEVVNKRATIKASAAAKPGDLVYLAADLDLSYIKSQVKVHKDKFRMAGIKVLPPRQTSRTSAA